MIRFRILNILLLLCIWHATASPAPSMTAKQASQLFSTVLITGNEGANYVEALEVLSHTKGYRDKMQTYCVRALDHYGWIMINNGRNELAERLFNEALVYLPSSDTIQRYDIISGLAYCYMISGKRAETKKILQQLLVYHKKQHMINEYIADLENLGTYYQSVNMPGKAIDCFKESQQLALNSKKWLQVCFTNHRLIQIFIDNNEKIKLLDQTLNLEMIHNLPQIMPQTHYYLSQAYFEGQQYEKALTEANTALEGAANFSGYVDSTDVIRLMAEIYTARQNFELANYYYRETDKRMASAINYNSKKIADQSRITNDLISWCRTHLVRNPKGDFELKSNVDKLAVGLAISLMVVLLLLLVSSALFNRYRKRERKKYIQLTEELDGQYKKVSDMENTISYLLLFYNNQNVLLTKIHNLIKQVVGRDVENNTRLRNIGLFIQDNKLESINSEFTAKQQKKTDEFIDRLTRLYPNLTDNEKQIAIFLWRGLSTHEICVLTGNQPRSVNMSRHRLRKSMSLSNDEDLVKYLQNI